MSTSRAPATRVPTKWPQRRPPARRPDVVGVGEGRLRHDVEEERVGEDGPIPVGLSRHHDASPTRARTSAPRRRR
jgi:hypothetical protein